MPWEDLTEQQKAFLDKHFTKRFSDFFVDRAKQSDNVAMTADYERALDLERAATLQVARLPEDYSEADKAKADLEAGRRAREAGEFGRAITLLSAIPEEIDQALAIWSPLVLDLRTEAGKAGDVADIGEPERKTLVDLGAEISALLTATPLPRRADVDAASLKVEELRKAKLAAPGLTATRVRQAFDDAFGKARDGLEKAVALDQAPYVKVAGKDALAAAVQTAGQTLEAARAADGAADRGVLETATAALLAAMASPTVEELRLTCAAQLAERNRRLAEIGTTRQGLQAEIGRLCGLPQDTVETGPLQRMIAFRNARLDKLVTAADLEGAEPELRDLETAIAALKVEEVEIGKAGALKAEALREWAALSADLRTARAIYVVAPEFKADVKAFASEDSSVQEFLYDKEFARALKGMDLLRPVMARLIARQSEFNGIVAKRAPVIAALDEFNKGYAAAMATPATTTEAAQARNRVDEVKANDLIKKMEWDAALPLLQDGIAKQKILVGLKAACDLLVPEFEDLGKRYTAFTATAASHLGAFAVDPPYVQQIERVWAKLVETRNLFNVQGDLPAAKTAMDDLEQLGVPLAALEAENDKAIQRRNDAQAEYTKNEDTLSDAANICPNTDKMLALCKQAKADLEAFTTGFRTGPSDLLDLLTAAVASAEAVLAEEVEDMKAAAQAKKAYDDRRAVIEPEVDDALALARKHKPDIADVDAEIVALWDQATDLYQAHRFLEALPVLEKCALAAAKVAGLVPQAEAKMAARKEDFEKRYIKALTDKVAAIKLYQRVKDDVLKAQADLDRLNKEVAAHAKAKEWDEGLAKLTKLEADVAEWVGFKSEHDQRVADRDWLKAEVAKIATRVAEARAMKSVDRQTETAVKRFGAAHAICSLKTKGGAYNYAEARAGFPEYLAAIDALLRLKAQHDRLIGQRDLARQEWDALDPKLDICDKMVGVTPELEKLVAAYDRAYALFKKHFWGFDFDSARAALPALDRAATALAAKQSEHDAALLQAKADATQAEQDLQTITPEDLKKKTPEEKLDLLNKLRGAKEKLTDDQREMQRKVYMAMDLDPDFLKVDEERRAKLIETIRGDKDLHDAKDSWATETPEKKVALLRKTLKSECDIYGMPVPEIVLFEEPPGDLGSFDPGTGLINLNIHPEATFDDFFDTIDTVVHENAHNYQDFLVKRLEEGLIQPGDPEYTQALMFAANSAPYGYVDSDEDSDCYKKEPVEEHAWKTGGDVQEALKKAPAKTS